MMTFRFRWPPRWWPWPPAPAPVIVPFPRPSLVEIQKQCLDAHNVERRKAGVRELADAPQLQAMAKSHADAMAASTVMSHDTSGDGAFEARMARSGYAYSRAAENIEWDAPNASEVVSAWMQDADHRANILGDFTEAGFAVAYAADRSPFWCADYGRP